MQKPFGRLWRTGRRVTLALLVAGVMAAGAPLPPVHASAPPRNLLANGSFELPFRPVAGCGSVGAYWNCFTNRGAANYGFYADDWSPVVADGATSQLIEINTYGIENGDNDRYAGIYQTVRILPGADYTLSFRGMIRTTNLDGDPWRYQVQVGYVAGPNVDWRYVTNWTDVGWNTYYERDAPGSFTTVEHSIKSKYEVITLFIRVWKKWGISNEELDVNLDAITLVGPLPQQPQK
jgi:hypothetical protein